MKVYKFHILIPKQQKLEDSRPKKRINFLIRTKTTRKVNDKFVQIVLDSFFLR